MKAWGMNGVNISLNEDCWLGINGVPSAYGGVNYQNAIIHYVQTIEANGMYPVLALHWDAPGTKQATGQSPMPDADHAPAFWQSVANTFKSDTAVVFRLKEEPYPAGNSDTSAAWKCWRDGGSACSEGYATVGMQSLVNTIRATGATNVIQVPGIQYANTMTQFLTYKPTDPLNNLMAVVDIYPDINPCGNTTCYNTYYAPIINQMPFMAGEFGESVNGNICGTTNSNTLMNWFDAHNSGYFAWTWDTWGTTCGDLSLILSYDGTPKSPNGTNYKSHLLALVGAATPTPTSVSTVGSTPTPTATKPAPTATSTVTPGASTATPTLTPTVSSATATPTKTATPVPATATPVPGSTLTVYSNAVAPGFSDGTFGDSAKNACDSAVNYSPTCSYSVTYTAWGGVDFQVVSGALSTSGFTTLQYELNPNGQPTGDFGVLFTNSSGTVINEIALTSNLTTTLPNGWLQVSIPIPQLNPSNVAIGSIQLKNELGGSLNSVHYDDVMLVGGASITSTPTPTSVPATTPTSTPRPTATPTPAPTCVMRGKKCR